MVAPTRQLRMAGLTSVGSLAIFRFARPLCYQSFPDEALPEELKDANPLGIWRMIDGHMTHEANAPTLNLPGQLNRCKHG
jgi:hypothetical protein